MEVMIVVVVIGILMTLAYPSLDNYLVRSRQTEAKANLMAIFTAQKIFYASNQQYASTLEELGIEISQGDAKYTYSINADGSSFLATAKGNIDDDDTEDTWTINQGKTLQNTRNDVTE